MLSARIFQECAAFACAFSKFTIKMTDLVGLRAAKSTMLYLLGRTDYLLILPGHTGLVPAANTGQPHLQPGSTLHVRPAAA